MKFFLAYEKLIVYTNKQLKESINFLIIERR